MSGRIPLDPLVVDSISIHVKTDGGVDAVFAALGVTGASSQHAVGPRTVTFQDHAWREAKVTIGGVRFWISGPHHAIDTSVPELAASAPALEIGAAQ